MDVDFEIRAGCRDQGAFWHSSRGVLWDTMGVYTAECYLLSEIAGDSQFYHHSSPPWARRAIVRFILPGLANGSEMNLGVKRLKPGIAFSGVLVHGALDLSPPKHISKIWYYCGTPNSTLIRWAEFLVKVLPERE